MKTSEQGLDVQVAIEEYKVLWDYYKITLAERKQLFEWYFKIIAIPVTVFAYMLSQASQINNIYFVYVGAVLIVIGICGITLYITYIAESINATNYFKQIVNVQKYFRDSILPLESVFPVKERDPRASSLGNDIIKISKGLPIPIINSAVIIVGIYLFNNLAINSYIIIWYSILLGIHLLIYFMMFKFRVI